MKELIKVTVLILIKLKNLKSACFVIIFILVMVLNIKPYVCNGCHDFSMCVQNLSDFFIVTIKNVDYRVYIVGVDKKAAIYLLNNCFR